jgi:RNA polymerase II subunit A small phosphatase-like protein
MKGKKTLVLDLDETLVHSSFKPPSGKEPPADIVLPVDIEGRICNVYILVRPGCLKFLNEMAKYYEVVIFTASLSKYADPLMDILDQKNVAPQRLFREHCTFHEQSGVFVKDLARLGRSLQDVIIIDNSPLSYAFQPENGMPILSWYDDRTDTKLLELIPVLHLLSEVPDVRPILLACCTRDNVYLTEKSMAMCSRLFDENSKRVTKQNVTQVVHIKSP